MTEPLVVQSEAQVERDDVRAAAEAVARAWKAHGPSALLVPYMEHLLEVLDR